MRSLISYAMLVLLLSACNSQDGEFSAAPPDDESVLASDENVSEPMEPTPDVESETALSSTDGDSEPPVADDQSSGDDTSAIAGLWLADSQGPVNEIDRRYVLISSDGLYTDYDDQMDPFGTGENCFIVTARRLELKEGEPASDIYTVSGLGMLGLSAGTDVSGPTLTVIMLDGNGKASEPVVWELADIRTVIVDFPVCDE